MENSGILRAGFGMNQFQETRADRGQQQNQYFISHDGEEVLWNRSNIKSSWTFAKIPTNSPINWVNVTKVRNDQFL